MRAPADTDADLDTTTSRVALRNRVRYRFDDYMARGSKAVLTGLVLVFTIAYMTIGLLRSLVLWAVGDLEVERGRGVGRQLWLTFLEITDPGSMTQDIDSSPWVKLFAIAAGLCGIVLLSALIAFITTGLDGRLSQLRKGHSTVLLDGHTLILGWNDRMIDILAELVIANESEDDPAVVILADRDKEAMDDELGLQLEDQRNTKIVTRSGAESSKVNLEIAAADRAKSVILLSTCGVGCTPDERAVADLQTIRTLLGLSAVLPQHADVPIVAEVFGDRERAAARTIDPRVMCPDAGDLLAKILVQTSRSDGLAVVYEELLSFDGAEIYLFEDNWPPGLTFGRAAFRFSDGIPIGVARGAEVELNPKPDSVLAEGDALVMVASDDSALGLAPGPVAEGAVAAEPAGSQVQRIERELLVGWTPSAETVVREYADYVLPGSQVDVLLRSPSDELRAEIRRIDAEIESIDVQVLDADPFDPEALLACEPFTYDNVIVLSQSEGSLRDQVDSETLLLLLHFQQIFKEHAPEGHATTLIAELLDSRNRDLVAQTGTREFIISNRIVSMIVAQLSEDARMDEVYENLFSEAGAEVYLKPAELYFADLSGSFTFADVMEAAALRGEVALGWKDLRQVDDSDQNFGVHLNPPKLDSIRLSPGDTIVVLAEDES